MAISILIAHIFVDLSSVLRMFERESALRTQEHGLPNR